MAAEQAMTSIKTTFYKKGTLIYSGIAKINKPGN
jgi:hypothetical protein